MNMSDWIRRQAGALPAEGQTVTRQELTPAQLERVRVYVEQGVAYQDALELVETYQVNSSPRPHFDMTTYIRRKAGRE